MRGGFDSPFDCENRPFRFMNIFNITDGHNLGYSSQVLEWINLKDHYERPASQSECRIRSLMYMIGCRSSTNKVVMKEQSVLSQGPGGLSRYSWAKGSISKADIKRDRNEASGVVLACTPMRFQKALSGDA
jgi:hypothetical protein